jgi:hypothetical protein
MLKARLLYAVSPSGFRHLEGECQALASRIMYVKEAAHLDESEWLADNLVQNAQHVG